MIIVSVRIPPSRVGKRARLTIMALPGQGSLPLPGEPPRPVGQPWPARSGGSRGRPCVAGEPPFPAPSAQSSRGQLAPLPEDLVAPTAVPTRGHARSPATVPLAAPPSPVVPFRTGARA
ncbi:hypothetical protein GCM10009559_33490 [Pseudonocardia zijingensis]|uniref:Uncharacterized protein n=1 Tax=Pseudonocardia zijingensis TaxID=153376 RepID=A0ABN1Q8N9_9PSEU